MKNTVFAVDIVRTLKNIGSILMLLIFLVPAAGFYYTKHSCTKSGEVQMVLDMDYSCCAEQAETICEMDISEPLACCTPELPVYNDNETDCCSNEGKYLINEEKYDLPSRAEVPHIEIHLTVATNIINPARYFFSFIEENTHPPPAKTSGEYLLQYGVMLI